MVSGVKSKSNRSKSEVRQNKAKMAEQIMSEVIAKAVAEVTRIVIQTIAELQAQRVPNTAGPKLGGPALKQPNFNWEAPNKYTKWKGFILEVRNLLSTYNAQ